MISPRNADPAGINGQGTNGQVRNAETIPPGQPAATTLTPQLLSGTGTVYTFSVMYNVPQGYEEQKPYVIAIVQLDEGPMVTAQLTDVAHDDVTIGMPVEMVTRKLREEGTEGQIVYGYKFRPVL